MDYDAEYAFHRYLSLAILCLSPIVVFILIGFRPPTYGKHVGVVSDTEPLAPTEEASVVSDKETPTTEEASVLPGKEACLLSSASDCTSQTISSNDAKMSLTKLRGSSENTDDSIACTDADDGANNKRPGTSSESVDNETKQKQRTNSMGPLLSASWSWFFFESPCWIWVVICLWAFYYQGNETNESEGRKHLPVQNALLMGWFSVHYLYRSIWYPLVMMRKTEQQNNSKKTSGGFPLGIAFTAWFYCNINGYLQARGLTKFSNPLFAADDETSSSIRHAIQFWGGVLLILIGFYIVNTSDRILLKLKKETQRKIALQKSRQSNEQNEHSRNGSGESCSSHYAVPYGGLFKHVSSPHYFGELLEWTGFCIASNFSLASLSFVVWTAANLVPRAIHTHKWYNKKFVADNGNCQDNEKNKNSNVGKDRDDDDCDENVDYSQLGRKAIIPFIL